MQYLFINARIETEPVLIYQKESSVLGIKVWDSEGGMYLVRYLNSFPGGTHAFYLYYFNLVSANRFN